MLNKYVEQELLIEIKREFGVIVSGKWNWISCRFIRI
jgi:hypothetical protein